MKSISTILKFVFLCMALSTVACSSPESDAESVGVQSITPVDAEKKYTSKEAIIVDVREQGEWNDKHIPGVIHIPIAQLSSRISELDQYKDSPVIMQCHSGKRSAKGAVILHSAGFKQVFNLDGGIVAWNEAGLVTEAAK